MKNKKVLDMLNLADDEYVIAASPQNAPKPTSDFRSKRTRAAMTCASCLLILLFGFVLIYNSIGYPYAKIARSLKSSDFLNGSYSNSISPEISFELGSANEYAGSATDQTYEEVTDNQVAGVIEEDLIKRSDKYIYYMHRSTRDEGKKPTLGIYSIEGENSQRVGIHEITGRYREYDIKVLGFYLSEDCTRITVIISYSYFHSEYNHTANTELISLDVSNPQDIKELNRITLLGNYVASRMVDGDILLFTKYNVNRSFDVYDPHTFVPHIDQGNGMEIITPDNIIVPDRITKHSYNVISRINEKDFTLKATVAYYSTYSNTVYISSDNIYLSHNYLVSTDKKAANYVTYTKNCTEIFKLSYSDNDLTPAGSVIVDGQIKNQYSMDEYNGILRVVTSTHERKADSQNASISADLYCIDINKMKIVSSVKQFAPQNETVQSVRFDKESAYVCTAIVIELTDPVFFFDLSDVENITYIHTGDIDGYSHSLVDFGDDLCLGIGVGNKKSTLKIEIYRKGASSVEPICSYEIESSYFPQNYKAYLVDRENKLVGLGIKLCNYKFDVVEDLYILLHFDGNNLEIVKSIEISGNPNNKRGVIIDGYLYVFAKSEFMVEKIG